jgi:hypothetical protein
MFLDNFFAYHFLKIYLHQSSELKSQRSRKTLTLRSWVRTASADRIL